MLKIFKLHDEDSAKSIGFLTLLQGKRIIMATQPPRLLTMRNLGGFLLPVRGEC
jgi:hypothetical protein